MKRTIASALVIAMLAGCAGTVRPATDYRPVVDMVGGTNHCPAGAPGCDVGALLDQDMRECNTFALQVDRDKSAAGHAIAGAVLGTIIGAAFGLRGSNLAAVAAYGAGAGVARGYVTADYANLSQYQIVQRCLSGRGWSVIN